jgi:hypothetical protein
VKQQAYRDFASCEKTKETMSEEPNDEVKDYSEVSDSVAFSLIEDLLRTRKVMFLSYLLPLTFLLRLRWQKQNI